MERDIACGEAEKRGGKAGMNGTSVCIIALFIMQTVCVIAMVGMIERIDVTDKSLWYQVRRLGNECDTLRARIWKLEQKDNSKE